MHLKSAESFIICPYKMFYKMSRVFFQKVWKTRHKCVKHITCKCVFISLELSTYVYKYKRTLVYEVFDYDVNRVATQTETYILCLCITFSNTNGLFKKRVVHQRHAQINYKCLARALRMNTIVSEHFQIAPSNEFGMKNLHFDHRKFIEEIQHTRG